MPQPEFGNLISGSDAVSVRFQQRHAQSDPHHTPLRRRVSPPWPPPAARRRLSPRPAPTATAQPQRQPASTALGLVAFSIARRSRVHRRLERACAVCCSAVDDAPCRHRRPPRPSGRAVLRLLEPCPCPPTPLSLAVSLPRQQISAAIAAPTSVAARCADPAWRPRLLLPPSPRPLLVALATLPQQLGSRRTHKPRVLACACSCKQAARRLLRAAPPTHVPIASRAPK